VFGFAGNAVADGPTVPATGERREYEVLEQRLFAEKTERFLRTCLYDTFFTQK
jgi:hypothetical protein